MTPTSNTSEKDLLTLCSELAASLNPGMFLHRQGRLVHVNPAMAEIMGESLQTAAGKEFLPFVHSSDRDKVSRALGNGATGSGKTLEFRILDTAGKTHWVQGSFMAVDESGQKAHVATITDVTAYKDSESASVTARRVLENRVAERTAELERTITRLQQDLAEKNRSENALRLSREKYAKAFDTSPHAAAITTYDEGIILEANRAFTEIVGYDRAEVLGRSTVQLGLWEDPSDRDRIKELMATQGSVRDFDLKLLRKNGTRVPGLFSAELVDLEGVPHIMTTFVDTSQLARANEAIADRDVELEVKSRQLQEVNEALRHLLGQTKEESHRLEQRIVANVEDLVLPYLRRLRDTGLSVDQKVYVNVVEANLSEIMAPFMRQISTKHTNLTPREIEVANLVRMGTTSKEIAKILNISKRAVEFHRDSLRRKLGLKKTKRNLRAYLASLN